MVNHNSNLSALTGRSMGGSSFDPSFYSAASFAGLERPSGSFTNFFARFDTFDNASRNPFGGSFSTNFYAGNFGTRTPDFANFLSGDALTTYSRMITDSQRLAPPTGLFGFVGGGNAPNLPAAPAPVSPSNVNANGPDDVDEEEDVDEADSANQGRIEDDDLEGIGERITERGYEEDDMTEIRDRLVEAARAQDDVEETRYVDRAIASMPRRTEPAEEEGADPVVREEWLPEFLPWYAENVGRLPEDMAARYPEQVEEFYALEEPGATEEPDAAPRPRSVTTRLRVSRATGTTTTISAVPPGSAAGDSAVNLNLYNISPVTEGESLPPRIPSRVVGYHGGLYRYSQDEGTYTVGSRVFRRAFGNVASTPEEFRYTYTTGGGRRRPRREPDQPGHLLRVTPDGVAHIPNDPNVYDRFSFEDDLPESLSENFEHGIYRHGDTWYRGVVPEGGGDPTSMVALEESQIPTEYDEDNGTIVFGRRPAATLRDDIDIDDPIDVMAILDQGLPAARERAEALETARDGQVNARGEAVAEDIETRLRGVEALEDTDGVSVEYDSEENRITINVEDEAVRTRVGEWLAADANRGVIAGALREAPRGYSLYVGDERVSATSHDARVRRASEILIGSEDNDDEPEAVGEGESGEPGAGPGAVPEPEPEPEATEEERPDPATGATEPGAEPEATAPDVEEPVTEVQVSGESVGINRQALNSYADQLRFVIGIVDDDEIQVNEENNVVRLNLSPAHAGVFHASVVPPVRGANNRYYNVENRQALIATLEDIPEGVRIYFRDVEITGSNGQERFDTLQVAALDRSRELEVNNHRARTEPSMQASQEGFNFVLYNAGIAEVNADNPNRIDITITPAQGSNFISRFQENRAASSYRDAMTRVLEELPEGAVVFVNGREITGTPQEMYTAMREEAARQGVAAVTGGTEPLRANEETLTAYTDDLETSLHGAVLVERNNNNVDLRFNSEQAESVLARFGRSQPVLGNDSANLRRHAQEAAGAFDYSLSIRPQGTTLRVNGIEVPASLSPNEQRDFILDSLERQEWAENFVQGTGLSNGVSPSTPRFQYRQREVTIGEQRVPAIYISAVDSDQAQSYLSSLNGHGTAPTTLATFLRSIPEGTRVYFQVGTRAVCITHRRGRDSNNNVTWAPIGDAEGRASRFRRVLETAAASEA